MVGPVYRTTSGLGLRATVIKGAVAVQNAVIEEGHVATGNTWLARKYNGCFKGTRTTRAKIDCFGNYCRPGTDPLITGRTNFTPRL